MGYSYWPAPAKLNLFLHITGQREDGYHLLQSVFQFLDYSDQIGFQLREDGRIKRVTEIEGVPEERDLIVRAARLLKQACGTRQGVEIKVDKILPMGGGLGGGSSDAATTLIVLNRLWQADLSIQQLADLGLQLGADVPVFVHGYAAFAEGVGEHLAPVSPEEPWYVVVHPGVNVSTAAVFQDSELTRDCPAIRICDLSEATLRNVCEPVAVRHYPQIAEVIDWLSQFAEARMTGTGACVFAAFNSEKQAQQVLEKLPARWHGFVAKGMNRSPLHLKLGIA